MTEFKIPPISTLMGGTWSNFTKTIKGNEIEPRHYLKLLLTALIILLCWPLRVHENLFFRKKLSSHRLKNDPIFIIGHWRSGTTHLHSVLCNSETASYFTTYFSVFPYYLKSKWLFMPIMRAKMPDKRPVDNVKLRPGGPQEDEFALSCLTPYSYYNFWLFPNRAAEFFDKNVLFKGPEKIQQEWEKVYDKLLKKANLEIPGDQLIIKNPVNTARIPSLLKLYPNAKFIYIYRNPYTVFLSSRKFFKEVLKTLWFHKINDSRIEELIIETYQKIYHAYERDKALIPAGNLVEVKFEDFESNPINTLSKIYDELSLDGFERDAAHFREYLNTVKRHKKNEYHASPAQLTRIWEQWSFAFEKYGYPKDPESERLYENSRVKAGN